jgi:signal peptidase I
MQENWLTKTRHSLYKFWDFVWNGEGILSWATCFVLAYVLIKFAVYPLLGVVFGTPYPIVAVVSGSMEHDGTFDDWWNSQCTKEIKQSDLYAQINIKQEEFLNYPFKSGFNKGDLMVLIGDENPNVGEVIVFDMPGRNYPIIHRVVEVKEEGKFYKTKGDHNCGSDPLERNISREKLYGKAALRIPYLGWLKIGFVELINKINELR